MAAPAILKSLTLSAFRGSALTFKLDFEKGKKLTLIYGENGTGKTTICDAFEFLAFERIGSLEDRGMGKGLEKFWPTAGNPAAALFVELETSAGKCSGRIVDKKVSISSTATRPRIELLRQRQVLELIQAQPAARYNAIKRFIDIDAFERSEEALRQLGKTLTVERQQIHVAEQENLSALQGYYEAAGKPAGLNAVTWAKQKLGEPTSGWDDDIVAIGKLRSAFDGLKDYPAKLSARQCALASAKTSLASAKQALGVALATASQDAGEALAVLEAGLRYLHAHPQSPECPLCRSNENIAGLAVEIDAQLKTFSALRSAKATKSAGQNALNSAETVLGQAQTDSQSAVTAFTTVQASHKWKAEVQIPAVSPPSDSVGLAAWLSTNEAISATWASVEAGWRDETKFLTQLKAAAARYETSAARLSESILLIPKVDSALTKCMEERQKFTDGIIKEIAQEVGKLYEKVHPGEGLDKIAIQLDPARRASLDLHVEFEGHDAPPQAYFSQSHLDTLGLCVFVALAQRDRADETVLILDDVLGSVDEPHVERVIGMIYENTTKFQHTIVTTHYRPWREKYRWGWLKPGQPCQFVELAGWGIGEGIRSIGSLPEIDRLRALLAESPIDPQGICSKAGVILEAVLDYLTLKYECAVPRRQGASYTLGDLLPAINGKLRDALKVEIRDGIKDPNAAPSSTIALKPILDELARIMQVRNAFGAHFKSITFELLDADAVGFSNHVLQLVDALTHPEDGWPSNDKSGSFWRNGADSRRLHPLKKPS